MRETARKIRQFCKSNPTAFLSDDAYQLASLRHAPDLADLIWEAKRALSKGIMPQICGRKASGTYLLKDCDEQPLAIFKVHHFWNEIAAYRLDYHHFAGIPQTAVTTLEHTVWGGRRVGSLQYFIRDSIPVSQSTEEQLKNFNPSAVRRMAALDIRLLNEDRNLVNILALEKELIPIDHGHVFAHFFGELQLVWMEWEQSCSAFTHSEKLYISMLDPEQDRRLLIDELHLPEIQANRFFVASVLLKIGAAMGLTPFEIGRLLTTPNPQEESSSFSKMIVRLKEKNPISWTHFSYCVYEEVEKICEYK